MIDKLATATYPQLFAEAVELEIKRARIRHAQVVLLAELNARDTLAELGYRDLPELIMAKLGCSQAEAAELAQAAEHYAARRAREGAPPPRASSGYSA